MKTSSDRRHSPCRWTRLLLNARLLAHLPLLMATVALSQTPALLEVKRLSADRVQIQLKGSPGSLHALQFSDELGNPIPWGTVTNIALGNDGAWTLETSTQASVRRYYRALTREGFTAPTNFVFIPPGTFMMGSPETEQLRSSVETQHPVTLTKGFWMGQHEVTQWEYLSVMGRNPSYWKNGRIPDFGSGGPVTNDVRHPVEQVTWIDATNYCGRLTQRDRAAGLIPADYEYRLPTEAEWEYACRAGSTNAFSFGTALRQGMANFYTLQEYDSSVGTQSKPWNIVIRRTVEVGSYPPNAFGLYDMHGNVWEWCSDRYGDYPAGNATDPKGPTSGILRVLRGGSWRTFGWGCRAANRSSGDLTNWISSLGLRVVLDPGQPKDPLTTVMGYVQDTNGVAVAGATVTVSFVATTAVTDASGRYVIANVPTALGKLTITATYAAGTTQLAGSSESLDPVRGGTTDAGVVVMKAGLPGMVWIPPGTFVMGSPETERERQIDETQHQVTLTKGFWMGRYEVTQGEYLSVMGSNPSGFKNWAYAYPPGTGGPVTNNVRHPVEQVRWIDATNYCGRLTQRDRAAGLIPADYAYRLPTEAEWEYACRAGSTNAFSFGTAIRQGMANFDTRNEYESSVGTQSKPRNILIYRTVEVGSYPPNAFGLYDMHGSVWEWCSDWYGNYPAGNATDPKGWSWSEFRVIRGGSWGYNGRYCRAAIRSAIYPHYNHDNLGFRVVLAPVQ